MHILYVHQNFPAQFGHIARYLVQSRGWQCTFLSETPPGQVEGVEKIQYQVSGGAIQQTHFCSRTFENAVWRADAVFTALRRRKERDPQWRPDLIVGHSGFGSTLFLSELFPNTPIVNLFEYYYSPHGPDSDMDFRRDLGWPTPVEKYNRTRCRNAMILLDMHNCDAAYTPTEFQKSRFPAEYQSKLQTIFDGVDRSVYHDYQDLLRQPDAPRTVAGITIPPNTRLVTYVSRGLESMRGFDIFMRTAQRIEQEYPDVLFMVVGADRVAYGGDLSHIHPATSFKQWVLARHGTDLTKFRFTGLLPPAELGQVLAASDLHIYLTVPFVLSWSMMNAMSCGAVVLGSDTAPVREMIRDGHNGLLADFFDVDALAEKSVRVLSDPAAYRPLGHAAEKLISDQYNLDVVLPKMLNLYDRAIAARRDKPPLPEPDLNIPIIQADAPPATNPGFRSPFRA
jgi:glycosyltransferase involved in cell wall biosynthesis